MRGLFGGRFDRDPADRFWTERDDPPVCPFCGERLERAGDESLSCGDCEAEWASAADVERSRKAAEAWPPEVG